MRILIVNDYLIKFITLLSNKLVFIKLFIYKKKGMTNLTRSTFQSHPFHLVSPSPWPIYTSVALLTLTTSAVLTMHGFNNANIFLMSAFLSVIFSMSF
jgi:hypothetical protein